MMGVRISTHLIFEKLFGLFGGAVAVVFFAVIFGIVIGDRFNLSPSIQTYIVSVMIMLGWFAVLWEVFE